MTKTLKIQIAAALLGVTCAGPAAAQGSLPARAVNALGTAIASQGNAALEQIRAELKDTLLEQIKPFLPKPEAQPDPKSDPANGARQ